MVCRDVFTDSPAEMLLTLKSKNWRLPVLTGSDQVRSVVFMTGRFPFKYGLFYVYGLSGDGVPVLNHKGYQLGGAKVQIQSRAGLVEYQICLIFCRSTVISRENTTDP